MKLIKKGAEADIYTGTWKNSKSLFKIRKIKNYHSFIVCSIFFTHDFVLKTPNL